MKFLTEDIDIEYKPGLYRKKTMNPAELAGQFIREWDERRLDKNNNEETPNLPPCICFSRKIGGGALEIADMVAEMVGFPVINNEIIEYIAEEANLNEKTVRLFDGRYPGKLREFMAMAFGEKAFVQSDYTKHLFTAVYAIAGLGPAIFVGRGVHLLLPRDRVLAVRIISSPEYRLKRISSVVNLSEADVQDIIQRVDREQKAFFRSVYGKKDASPYEFDLIINRDHIEDPKRAGNLISTAFKEKFSSELEDRAAA